MQTAMDIQGKIQVDTLILGADSIAANLLDRARLPSTSEERLTENEYVILSVVHLRQNLVNVSQAIPELNEQIAEISELIVELYTQPSADSSVTLMDLESAISNHIAQLQQYDSKELDGIVNRFCLELSAWKNVIYSRISEKELKAQETIEIPRYVALPTEAINSIKTAEQLKSVLMSRFNVLSDYMFTREYSKRFAFLPLEFSGAIAAFKDLNVSNIPGFIAHIRMFLSAERNELNPIVKETLTEFLSELDSFNSRLRRIYLTTET